VFDPKIIQRVVKEHELSYWNIRGYQYEKDSIYRKFWKYEKSGKIGYSISSESALEKEILNKWQKQFSSEQLYISRFFFVDYVCDYIGCYDSWSRCIWIDPSLVTEFENLMDSFIPRTEIIGINGEINQQAKKYLKNLNHVIVSGNEYSSYPFKKIISLETFEKIDELKIMLALSQ